jgi:hypothetical protein
MWALVTMPTILHQVAQFAVHAENPLPGAEAVDLLADVPVNARHVWMEAGLLVSKSIYLGQWGLVRIGYVLAASLAAT